jgi:hypothetical protein
MKNEEHLYMQFHIILMGFLLFMKNKKSKVD